MTDREAMQQAQLETLDGTLWILNQELTRKQAEIDALRKLMQQALEILEKHVDYYDYEHFTSVCELEPAKDLILALRERLAQPQRTHWEGCEEVHPECKEKNA